MYILNLETVERFHTSSPYRLVEMMHLTSHSSARDVAEYIQITSRIVWAIYGKRVRSSSPTEFVEDMNARGFISRKDD